MRIIVMRITNIRDVEGADMSVKVAVIYSSATGTGHALARAVANGATSAGA